jgi:hypothetical protein
MDMRNAQVQRQGESGNVLFLILIAVVLFAALSYAVTQSSRSGGGDANSEKSLISSAQLTQYPAGIRTSIVRMILNGVDVTRLVFNQPSDFGAGEPIDDTNIDPADTANYNVAHAKTVHAAEFHPLGGGATYSPAPADMMDSGQQTDWIFTGAYEVDKIGTSKDSSADGNDIIAFLPGVTAATCKKLNTQLGILATSSSDSNGNGVPSAGSEADVPTTTDAMIADSSGDPYGIPATEKVIGGAFSGQPYGCYDSDDSTSGGDGPYVYYHVLVER